MTAAGPEPSRTRARRRAAGAALLVASVVAAYANVLPAPFLPDDDLAIRLDPDLASPWSSLRAFHGERQTSLAGRPFAALTLALDRAAGGLDPRGYRAVNVLLHAAAALLLWSLAAATWRRIRPAAGDGGVPLAIALVWAVHPLATQAVNYVVQRTEILAALSILAALRLSTRGAEPGARAGWSAAAVAAAALGALSKENAAAGPVLVLIHDACFLSGSWRAALRRRPGLYAGLAATWLPVAVAVGRGVRDDVAGAGLGVSRWEYLLTQAGVVAHYLRLALWPSPLVVSYQDWPLARSLADVWPQALLLAALLAASAALVARRSWIGFAGAAFFLVLAPSSSVVPVVSELAAEHRMYLPLASVVAVVTATAAWALRRAAALLPAGPGARAAPVAALGVAAALGIATHARNSDYRTSAALWSDAVEKRPRNPVAHAALGYAVEQEGDPLRAVEEYRIAIALDPGYAEAWLNLAFALRTLGRHGEAAEAYATARRLAAPAAHRRAGR